MKIVSSRSSRKDNTAKVHISSMETPESTDSQSMILNVDIAFRLEINQFPTPEGKLGHQLMLSVADVAQVIHETGLGVQHLVDLGVLAFTEDDPAFDEDVICRDDNGRDLWVATDELRRVWRTLTSEVGNYGEVRLESPYVPQDRRIRIAIDGMDYFNAFVSPDITEQSPIYFSNRNRVGPKEPGPEFTLPALFK